jgi:hypothetical protein
MAKIHLLGCIRRMEGKYGTHGAVSNLKFAMGWIDDCVSKDNNNISFYQRFRNPPNTPKSRRLGWHEKGETDE